MENARYYFLLCLRIFKAAIMQMYVFFEDKCKLLCIYSFEVMIFKYFIRGKIIKKIPSRVGYHDACV